MRERRLRRDAIPRHVAVIMDGNGRWAQARGLSRVEGHHAGLDSVRGVLRAAHELGVKILTLYAFSSENWSRPKGEVDALMQLLDRYIDEEVDEVDRNGIQIRTMGQLADVPRRIRQKLDEAIARTAGNDEMVLCFALSYGGRQEIVDAARELALQVEEGKLRASDIDEKLLSAHLYQPDLPDPDLLIRTGAETRVSNFLLWQIAYSELHFSDVMWPDFRREDLVNAILDYQARERRFGLISAQVRSGRAEDA
jgi:undecaprenyl diphosphate synthase